jgi:type IV pilus assembly protein PilC
MLSTQTEKKKMRESIEKILENLREGFAFYEALERQQGIFPQIVVRSIEAAEISGTLDKTLEELSDHLARDHELEEKIKSTLVYPAIIISLTVAVLMVLLIFVIPAFQNVMNSLGVQLPLPTKVVLHTGIALRRGWYAIFVLLLALTFFAIRLMKSERARRKVDKWLLKAPIVGILYEKAVISRFSRILGTLLKSGVPIMEALEVAARTVGNQVVGDVILQARENIREGRSVADTLEISGLFPPMVTAMIAVGEETGALDALLERVNNFYERELEEATRRLSSMIEPVMIVVLGAAVGFIVISILLPYFQIIGNMG